MRVLPSGPYNSAMAKHNFHPNYRPDIDGLRALAVLAVVVFHAFPGKLRGGFVGVDVFFVISGFLISTIIFKSLERGNFSFLEFYVHRVRRIFPALLVVLAAMCVLGWLFLLPEEYEMLGRHVAAAAGFVENFVLWKEAGYFNPVSELKPLTHLWSLAVEEQFYLAYPLLIWIGWRSRFGILPVVSALTALSFCLNIVEIGRDPVATFFLPHTRLWELLSGSILAYITASRSVSARPTMDGAMSVVGGLLLVVSAIVIDQDDRFPGWLALLPVVGAVLIIRAGPDAWLNRNILAHRLMIFVGVISYPLYLWHWPLLSFARIVYGETPSPLIRIILVSISFLLAWLTYSLIERQFRFGRSAMLKAALLTGLMVAVGACGLSLWRFDNRETTANLTSDFDHRRFFGYISTHFDECGPQKLREAAVRFEGVRRCAQTRAAERRTVAIVGDSHAEHLFIGVAEELGASQNVVYYQYPCEPFFAQNEDAQCGAMTEAIEYVASNPLIRTVVIAGYWVGRFQLKGKTDAESAAFFEQGLESTFKKLSNKEVYIALDVPSFPFDSRGCVSRPNPLGLHRSERCEMPRAGHEEATKMYRTALKRVAGRFPSVRVLDLAKYLCNDQTCSMRRGGLLMYRDGSHLSVEGSKYVGAEIARAITEP